MKHNIKIYKTMIQLRMIFSAIAFYEKQLLFIILLWLIYLNAVNQGGKRERGSGVGGNSKSGKLPLIP